MAQGAVACIHLERRSPSRCLIYLSLWERTLAAARREILREFLDNCDISSRGAIYLDLLADSSAGVWTPGTFQR